MMKSIIKKISAFFLLSFLNVLRSHARMLPAAGENGIFEFIDISYNEEKEWMSMVAEQIISSNSFISNYRKRPSPAPPSLRSAPPRQPGISDYNNRPGAKPSSLVKSWKIISDMIRKPTQPPPPAPSASLPKTGMSNYIKPLPPPPPSPKTSPIIHHIIPVKPKMSDYGKVARSPPPPPLTSPTKGHEESSTVIRGHSSRSPPPSDIWIASTLIADC